MLFAYATMPSKATLALGQLAWFGVSRNLKQRNCLTILSFLATVSPYMIVCIYGVCAAGRNEEPMYAVVVVAQVVSRYDGFAYVVGHYRNPGDAWCCTRPHLSILYNWCTVCTRSHDCVRQQCVVVFVIRGQITRSLDKNLRWRRLVLAKTHDLTLPLCNTFDPFQSDFASVVSNAVLAFTVHCYCVVCIMGGTCITSRIAICTNYWSGNLMIDRAYGRD